MSGKEPDASRIHPAIEHYEKTGSTAVELSGYIGSERAGLVIIYRDLNATSWIEIAKGDVVDTAYDPDKPGLVKVTVSADAKLATVYKNVVSAREIADGRSTTDIRSITGGGLSIRQPRYQLPDAVFAFGDRSSCLRQCIDDWRNSDWVQKAQVDLNDAAQIWHDEGLAGLLRAVNKRNDALDKLRVAATLLRNCISACQPPPLFIGTVDSLISALESQYLNWPMLPI